MSEYMDILTYTGEGYQALLDSDSWRVAFLRYNQRFSAYDQVERHMGTDEIFLLLTGHAVLYVEDEPVLLEACKMVNVRRGVWHHIVVTPDTTVMIVENSDTCAGNTEKMTLVEYRETKRKGENHADQ